MSAIGQTKSQELIRLLKLYGKHIVNKSAALKSNLDCLLLYLTNPQIKHRTK